MFGFSHLQLTLCDCPGLVMPSFALSRSEMILNGILSIDHIRDYISPISLLLTRIPVHVFEDAYSVMLNEGAREKSLNARDLLTAIAFIRGNFCYDQVRVFRLARFIYFEKCMHVVSVLKGTAYWEFVRT